MKIKLVEKMNINIPQENIKVFEKTKLVESANSKYDALGILENVPFGKFNFVNANNRYYPRECFELLISSKIGEGAKCYANHAEKDNDVTKLTGIWHNIRLNDSDNTGRGDLYCVGEYGQLLLNALKAGSKGEGMSTTAWGEYAQDYDELKKYEGLNLGRDVQIVRPSTMDWQSPSDWVDSPSAGVVARLENIVQEQKENSSNLQESYTNNSTTIEKLDENIVSKENKKEVYMDKSILKNMVKSEITIAKNNPKLVEAIQGLKEVDCAGDAELTGKINVAINEITAKLEESKNVTEKQLTEKVSKLEEMTARYNKLSEGYKKVRAKVVELSESTKIRESDINYLTEDCGKRDNDIKCLTEDRKVMIADLKKIVEKYKNLKKENKTFAAKIKEAEEVIGKQENELEKLGFNFEEEEKEELDADGNPIVKVEAPAEEVKEEELPAPEVLPTEAPKPEAVPVLAEEGDEQELPAPDTLPTEPAMAEEEMMKSH